MRKVVNLISSRTYDDHLGQLARLASPDDALFCAGKCPFKTDLKPVELPWRMLGWKTANILASNIGRDNIIHAWDIYSARIAARCARKTSAKLVISLPRIDAIEKRVARLIGQLKGTKTHITAPTQAALEKLNKIVSANGITTSVLPVCVDEIAGSDQIRRRVRDALGLKPTDFLILALTADHRSSGYRQAGLVHGIAREFIENLKIVMPLGKHRAGEIESLSRVLGSRQEVFATGNSLSRFELICACDAGLFLHTKDCGAAGIIETTAAAKPVILSNLPEITELFDKLDDNDRPNFVNPTELRIMMDYLDDIVTDRESARPRAEMVQKFVLEKFPVSAARQKLNSIYSALSG